MADKMPPPGGVPGGMPGGMMGAAQDPVRKNMSFFNPIDAAAMRNDMSQVDLDNPTVVDFLPRIGIDPQGPLRQLVEFGQKQVQNGDMLGKMKNIAKDSGQPQGQPGGGAPTQGLDDLLNATRR
jgi:hypothetical protein